MSEFCMDKDLILKYLSELAKEIKKELGRKTKVELIIVGGASVILNYGFRQSTIDIDAMKAHSLSVKNCIHRIADSERLPDDWINFDFQNTVSYSQKLAERSKFFNTFNQVLDVYTVKDAPLICMKLIAFRTNKDDLLDIIGILENNRSITCKDIDDEMRYIYGGWDKVSTDAVTFLDSLDIQGKEITQRLLAEKKPCVSIMDKLGSYSRTDSDCARPSECDEFER